MTAVRRLLGVPLTLALASEAYADNYFPTWPVALQTDVIRAARTFPGEFAIYVKDLATGTRYEYNAATPIYLASTIKIAVMIELFRQVEAKQVSLDEELVYSAPDVRDGAPLLSFLRVGTPVSIQILLEAMIQQSDNAATDMLIRHIGLDNVNRGLVKEGLFGFGPITTLLDVRRLMYQHIDPGTADLSPQQIFMLGVTRPLDMRLQALTELLDRPPNSFSKLDWSRAFESYYELGYNTGPLESIGNLLEALERGKIVNAARSRQMIEIMLATQTGTRRMRAGLPLGTLVAHKTGTQYRRICDVGIFYMATNRPIVFAACVKGGRKRQAEDVIARIARRTYWHLSPQAERKKLRFPADVSVALPEEDEEEYSEEEDLLAPAIRSKLKTPPPKRKSKKKAAPAPTPPAPPAKKLMK
jgi:beta-lactamase class A